MAEKQTKKRVKDYKKTRRTILIIFSILMVLIIGVGGLAIKVILDIDKTMETVHQEVDTSDMRKAKEESSEESSEAEKEESSEEESDKTTIQDLSSEAKPLGILLIGTDTGDFGRTATNGLSDTLIYCVLNPSKEELTLLSIPRDTYTEIIGRGSYDKINAAYSYGGAEMCINTVQNLLGVPVDAYAAVNFAGFQEIIDAIGGVTVENAFDFSWDGYYFPEGTVTLNGAEALAFCRMRKNDPEGDFGRSRRQRDVVIAAAKKCNSMAGALNYQSLLTTIAANVITDLDLDEALSIRSSYSKCLKNIESMETLTGYGVNEGGWYYMLDEANLAEVTAHLREELELD